MPVFEGMSVLDALLWVQQNADATLAFRCACRVGMCGSCGVVINGTEGLACRTPIAQVGREVRLQPLRNLPVVRDLVVDMAPFFERYRRVMPHFIPRDGYKDLARIPPASREREVIDEQRECITCALCLSACTMVAMDSRYIGPAALNRAYCLVADSRDGAREERLALAAREWGLWRCHTLFNCAQVCPKGIVPTQAIQRLKRKAIARRLLGVIMPWRAASSHPD